MCETLLQYNRALENLFMDPIRDSKRDFSSLYRATLQPLRRYLSRLLGNSSEAQDIAHDAYVRIYPKIENNSATQPEALLYTTARRLAFNRLKRRRISPFINAPAYVDNASSPAPGVAQEVIARQELARLEIAIARLPAGCRTVLLLRKLELLPHQEIAKRLGISVSTVEKQHARALRLLRADLQVDQDTTTVPGPVAADQETMS